ncbi:unnamed protein product [Allacma fusca]|uniref:Immunoglobulin-like beta-sandwich domain-containing protein n=1 Tax=Allacma fusca TaxID=39272 RepID=A0A8J2P1H2_9HEXA|nr:unnamed protein product [Allacma fusca]
MRNLLLLLLVTFASQSIALVLNNNKLDYVDVPTSNTPKIDNFYFGKTIQLTCNASFPIQWVYTGDGAPAVHTETFRLARDFFNVDSYIFQASVVFSHTAERQTGNYTCQGIDRPELHAYFYVYVPGNTTFLLDNDKPHTVHVNPKISDAWITLPCTVTNASAKVQLYKYLNNETLEHLEPNENLTYDTKVGFNMLPKTVTEMMGEYVCSYEQEHRQDKLRITVKPLMEDDRDNELPVGKSPLELVYDKRNHRLVCCNKRSQERPNIKTASCESLSDCSMKNKFLRRKKCSGICEHHVVPVKTSCVAYELSETREAGIIECFYDDYVAFHQFSKEQDVIITDFNEMPPIEEILSIMKEDVPPGRTKGVRDRYVCHANSFFFSTGLKMAWENPDGTMDFIEETHFPLSNAIEIDANDNNNMTRLFCFAPIWDSPLEWKNVSIYFIWTIRDSEKSTRASITVELFKPRKFLPALKDSYSMEMEESVKNGFLSALARVAESKGMHMRLSNKYGDIPYVRDTMRSLVNSLGQHRTDSDERIEEGIEGIVSQNWDYYFALVQNKTFSSTDDDNDYNYYQDIPGHRRHYKDYAISKPGGLSGKKSVSLLWIIPALIIIVLLGVTLFFVYWKNRVGPATMPRIIKGMTFVSMGSYPLGLKTFHDITNFSYSY